jgi:PKHD-type hydroxylase
MSIQLANGYQGGTLQVGLPNNPVEVDTTPGTATCFPSWMPHTVEPVTKGTRYSLVAWGHVPAVR